MENEVAFDVILLEPREINGREVSISLLQATVDDNRYIIDRPDSVPTAEFIIGIDFRDTFVSVSISNSSLSSKQHELNKQISCNICGSLSNKCVILKSGDLFESTEESIRAFIGDSNLDYDGGMPPAGSSSICDSCISEIDPIIDQIMDEIDLSSLAADGL